MKKKSLLIGLAALLFPMSMAAQYTIYPVPHSQTAGKGTVNFTPTVNVVCEDGIDIYTRNRVQQILGDHGLTTRITDTPIEAEANIFLGVKGSNGVAVQKAAALGLNTDVLSKANKFDRHILSLTDGGSGNAQLVIIGENTDATFYGLASLEQMLDQGTTGLPTVTINDYADLKERGIIEGFYGKPYDNEVRKDLMRYMMRFKMNSYVYGPKCDPYHSSTWADPYPTTITSTQDQQGFMTQAKMQDLTETAHASKVNVSWAIHPGNSLLNDGQVVSKIMSKFESMYNLGFRQFAVFVDDVGVPSQQSGMNLTCQRITDLQRAIEAKWNTPGAAAADTVKALRLTPQIYCRTFAGSDAQFNNFFKALSKLPENVTVYYTGHGVWSVPNNTDLKTVQDQFGRNVIWWWNYPCNDNGTGPSEIYPLDMKSNFVDMPNVGNESSLSSELTESNQGVICNPMEQGEVSKTAVFSAGDYSWNNTGFDNMQSWEASIKSLFPGNNDATEAYRFLAPYLSKNDPETLNTILTAYKKNGNSEDLKNLLSQIEENCDKLGKLETSEKANESLFYKDIKPWVVRLHDLAVNINKYISVKDFGTDAEQAWPTYINALNEFDESNESYYTHHLSGFGSTSISTEPRLTHASYRYLTPFVNYIKENATSNLFTAKPTSTTSTGFTNVEDLRVTGTVTASLIRFQANKRGVTLNKGEYIGLELSSAIRINYVTMADSLLDHSKLNVVVSTDGKHWTTINRTGNEWLEKPEAGSGKYAGYARFVAIVNDSEEPTSITVRNGIVNLYPAQKAATSAAAAPNGAEFWQSHTANLMSDGNYNTFVCINRVQKAGDTYTITLKEETPVEHVRIVMGTTNGDNINKGLVQISKDGKKWTALRPTGASSNYYTLDLPQNFKVGTVDGADVYACDFSMSNTAGKVTPTLAKYVRLYVSTPANEKWLRLHEIEVNGKGLNEMPCFQAGQYGITEHNATDGRGYTSSANFAPYSSKDRVFTYYMTNSILLNGITLYTDPTTMEGLTYNITTDGENWKEIKPSSAQNGIIRFTFEGENRAATALKINWNTKTVPAIYEVVENYDEANVERPTVTRIESVSSSSQSATEQIDLATEGSHLVAKAQSGINSVEAYTLDGRTLFNQKANGEAQVTIPVVGATHQTILVKVTILGGKSQTFKIMK